MIGDSRQHFKVEAVTHQRNLLWSWLCSNFSDVLFSELLLSFRVLKKRYLWRNIKVLEFFFLILFVCLKLPSEQQMKGAPLVSIQACIFQLFGCTPDTCPVAFSASLKCFQFAYRVQCPWMTEPSFLHYPYSFTF